MATIERVRMTPTEFRQLGETAQPTELIDGEVIVSPTPVTKHQRIVGRIFVLLDHLITAGSLYGEAVVSPMDVWLDDNCVQPDVFWVSGAESKCKLGEDGYWYGAPDLVVEVLSPSTAHKDRRVKFDMYEKHGVREYWLIDPDGQYMEIFVREGEKLARMGAFGLGEAFVSNVLGGVSIDAAALLKA